MASLQLRSELETAFAADVTDVVAEATPARRGALVACLTEHGLTTTAAERLLREMESLRGGQLPSLEQLSSRMQRLQRVLPEADMGAMLAKDPAILDADISLAIRNMVQLVAAFPGKDLTSVVSRAPRLLYCADLPERLQRVCDHLVALHPSRDPRIVGATVAEYPELLYRMDYYKHARMLDELPIEVQNMFVVADQGIGFLHRYYKRRGNNFVADTSDEEAGF